MDLRLPLLADANLHLNVAEEAVAEGAWTTVRNELEKADAALEELRSIWPEMDTAEQGVMTALAQPLKQRYATLSEQVPPLRVLIDGKPEEDPEQELAPDDEPAIAGAPLDSGPLVPADSN